MHSTSAKNALSTTGTFGVVEGFYWGSKHAYCGLSGEYSFEQRKDLLQFMKTKGLDVYVYAPKEKREQRSITPLEGEALEQWREVVRIAENIRIVWGLKPPNFDEETFHKVKNVVHRLLDIGIVGVALLCDDTLRPVDRGNDELVQRQVRLQVDFLNRLWTIFKDRIKAYCPECYYGDPQKIERNLSYAAEHAPPIPFVFTGLNSGCNMVLEKRHFPSLANRKIILWDNWIASDNLTTITLIPPKNREKGLLQEVSGYWLNLLFPVLRVIPTVSSIAFLKLHGRSPVRVEIEEMFLKTGGIADEWAAFMQCSPELTRAVLRIKLNNQDAPINPDIKNVISTDDRTSIELLLTVGSLNVHEKVKDGKTLRQIAEELENAQLVSFLREKEAEISSS